MNWDKEAQRSVERLEGMQEPAEAVDAAKGGGRPLSYDPEDGGRQQGHDDDEDRVLLEVRPAGTPSGLLHTIHEETAGQHCHSEPQPADTPRIGSSPAVAETPDNSRPG